MRQGDPGDDAYEVVSGTFEILRGSEETRISVVGPGATVGEIAMLAGCPRTATVRALEPCVVRPIGRAAYERWMSEDAGRWRALADLARARIDEHRLLTMIIEVLDVAPAVAADIVASSEWRHLAAGEQLFAEGDPPDAAYLIVSGRLAIVEGGTHVREVARGEVVGEIGLIEQAPRSASVAALRDSTLARFSVETFRSLIATHPALMLQVTRTVLARLSRRTAPTDRARSIAVAVTAPIDGRAWLTRIAAELARHGSTQHLWSAGVDDALGRPGLLGSGLSVAQPAVAEHLQEAETTHDYLLLETDPDDSHWTRTTLALADRIVVVASAQPDDDEVRRISSVLAGTSAGTRVERWLALVQRPGAARPASSAALADRLGFDRVAHARDGSPADLARLARLVSGNGTGLVLGGGGARGFAHLGVWRALRELGIEIDAIGGVARSVRRSA